MELFDARNFYLRPLLVDQKAISVGTVNRGIRIGLQLTVSQTVYHCLKPQTYTLSTDLLEAIHILLCNIKFYQYDLSVLIINIYHVFVYIIIL